MNNDRWNSVGFVATIVAIAALSNTGLAQASRTWVSGVGDDANPCSRTAPCKTFAGAISKTAPGGEIDVLDPGGFGAVTITKALSIVSVDIAGVLVSGTNGIVVAAGANDEVVLRGLDIEGLGVGLAGVRFVTGSALHIEKCTINDFTQPAVDFEPNNASGSTAWLYVKDTVIRTNSGGGVLVHAAAGNIARAFLDNVSCDGNYWGLHAGNGAIVAVRHSSFSGSTLSAVVSALGAAIHVSDTVVAHNLHGLVANADSTLTISNVTCTGNTGKGLSTAGNGVIKSFGNNFVAGNGTDGAPNPPNLSPM